MTIITLIQLFSHTLIIQLTQPLDFRQRETIWEKPSLHLTFSLSAHCGRAVKK